MNRSAVVAGATGLIGNELVQLLLKEPAYNAVTLVVRRQVGISHPKLKEMVIDFDLMEQSEVNLTKADVFCTLGTTMKKAGTQEAFRKVDFDYPLTLGRMSREQGANQFLIVTSIGANPSSRVFYSRVKGEIEDALTRLCLPALHIFRPSLLLGNRNEFRLGERIASSVIGLLLPLLSRLLRKYNPIQARTVAKAMILQAQKDQKGNHIYESDQITQIGESSRND